LVGIDKGNVMNWKNLWEEDISLIKDPMDTRKNKEDRLEPSQINSLQAICHALQERNGVILADEVGLGKTWVALELVRRIINKGGKVAIVAKEGILRKWENEWIEGWGTEEEIKFYENGLKGRAFGINSRKTPLQFIPSTLTRRNVWKGVGKKTILNIKPDLIILDEAHNCLTGKKIKELIEALKGLSGNKKIEEGQEDVRVLALTATPLGIDIDSNHWARFFNLLGLKEEEKLNEIARISRGIIHSDFDKETEKNEKLIADYRKQFKGIIFRSRRETYYQEKFKKIYKNKFGGNFENQRINEAVNQRIERIPRDIIITEEQKEKWRTLICAVEALSFCPSERENKSGFDKRSRLTVANTHCLLRIIEDFELEQEEDKGDDKEGEDVTDPIKLEKKIWENIAKECLRTLFGSSSGKEEKKKNVVKENPLYKGVIEIVKKHFEEGKEDRVLIFSYNTTPAKILRDILDDELKKIFKDREGKYCQCIDGGTSEQERRKVIKEFSECGDHQSKLKCLIAQIRVAGEGLDLHKNCDTVIFLQPEWNPIYVEQGIGRVDRVKSLWVNKMEKWDPRKSEDSPKITVYFPRFKDTYNFSKWNVLEQRWKVMKIVLNGKDDSHDDVLHPAHYLKGVPKRSLR